MSNFAAIFGTLTELVSPADEVTSEIIDGFLNIHYGFLDGYVKFSIHFCLIGLAGLRMPKPKN
jgi:hypothetical protein